MGALVLMYLFNKYKMSIYYVLKFIQDPRNTAVNKEAKTPCPPGKLQEEVLGRDISSLHFTVVDLVCALLWSVLCYSVKAP